MTALAILAPLDVEARQIASNADRMIELREWVMDADAGEAADVQRRAHLAAEWLKLIKASAVLAVEATRLEAAALRRLGQLGALDSLNTPRKSAARELARMTAGEFAAFLDGIPAHTSVVAVLRRRTQDERDREDQRRRHRIAQGQADQPVDTFTPYDRDDIAKASEVLLARFSTTHASFTVAEVAEELRGALEITTTDVATTDGLKDLVRAAISATDAGSFDGDKRQPFPAFVTYEEDDGDGFVRIPWHKAGLEQLRFMANYRQNQADALAAKAGDLLALVEILDEVRHSRPDLSLCRDLAANASRRTLDNWQHKLWDNRADAVGKRPS